MQFRGRGRTDARRIAQPHFFPHGREVEIELPVVVGGVAFQVERAAAGASRELVDMNAVPRERQRAIHLAQAAGQPGIIGGSVLDLDAALRKRLAQRTPQRHMDRRQTRSGEIRGHAAQQLEINLPVGREIEFPRPREMNRTVSDDVRSLSHQMRRFDVSRLIAHT